MDDVWSKFAQIADNPLDAAAEFKKTTDRKVIGCHPMHVPEELIHSAGALPVSLLGGGGPILLAGKHLQSSFICLPVRYNLERQMQGDFAVLDGVVFPDICEETRCLADLWKANCPCDFHHSLLLPVNLSVPQAKDFLVSELTKLKTSLENFTGQKISEEALRKSISLYNRNRQLLDQLYEIRRSNPGLFRARDMATAVASSMLMPKEAHNELLSSLLKQIEGARNPAQGEARLLLSGALCEMPELDVLDLVEELGARVVDDDLYVGSRYFSTLVNETLEPIEALADRFLKDVPCPTKINQTRDWGTYLLDKAQRAKAGGIVLFLPKFCEPQGFDYPLLKDRLTAAGIPHLLLQMDHSGSSGQIRTRFQAFVELIERG